MAEGVVSFLLEKVIGFAQEEISKAVSAKRALEKLEQELRSIQPILRDAHTKQFESKDVKDWILRLNEVAYDALDVIDLYRTQCRTPPSSSKQSKVLKTLNVLPKISKRIGHLWEIGDKIQEINKRLSVLFNEKDRYSLVPLMVEEGSGSVFNMSGSSEARQTTATITEANIIGREEDEELVVKWLLEEPQDHASVVAIVGMGGVGKTTLAKIIYNNIDVEKRFEKCMWVCVSENPKLVDLFRKFLEEVDDKEKGSNQLINLNSLSSQIRPHLKDKKLLLVLDDVWDYGWWNEMKGLWRGASSDSKILITTRSMTVANGMGVDHLHELKRLRDEQSWQLFLEKSLRNGEVEHDLDGVKEISEEMVERCGGLPLALSTVGSVMRQKERSRSVWRDVFNSPFWNWEGPYTHNSIFGAIALSYMNIPFSLKQCLTYCCIFPKDFPMAKETLVRLWVAEGFIPKDEGTDLEILAEEYLEALVDCNLIQFDGLAKYSLHDIVHDFALYVRGEEHVSGDLLQTKGFSPHARSLSSFGRKHSFEIPSEQKLRTLIWRENDRFPFTSFAAFKWLRVLDLKEANILGLPESVGDLVLLKYLNLSQTRISELPQTIVKLQDLQTLDLSRSDVKRLPENMSSFEALRHLDLHRTHYLEYLPVEIGKLTGLQTLSKFVVGSDEMDGKGSSIEELRDLNNLRGTLEIHHLERIDSNMDSQRAQLERKENLKSLMLSMDFDGEVSMETIQNVYEALQPPIDISKLDIRKYVGVRMPTWMSSITFCSLKELYLCDCLFLESIPSLGHLPKLVKLYINAPTVRVFNTTVPDHVATGFPKLEKLKLVGTVSLEQWSLEADAGREIMPLLRTLIIIVCPKLKALPFFPTLEHIRIRNMENWEGWPTEKERVFPCLKVLKISGSCLNLKGLPDCPVLEELQIDGCSELVKLPFSSQLSSLKRLALRDLCLEMNCFRSINWSMNPIKQVIIERCPQLVSLVDELKRHPLPVLQFLKVAPLRGKSDISGFVSEEKHNLLTCLLIIDSIEMNCKLSGLVNMRDKVITLIIRVLPPLHSLPDWIEQLHQIRRLNIEKSDILTELPAWLDKLSKLRHLRLYSLQELSSLPDAIATLSQLETFDIISCPKLTVLPDWVQRLPRLRSLYIFECDVLVNRYRKEDWHKISHIPNVTLY